MNIIDQMVGKINVKEVSNWNIPTDSTGAILLTMPNIPRPLHELNPRLLVGKDGWNSLRLSCFKKARYLCEVCGKKLTTKTAQPHELYSYSYTSCTASFQRCVCLCHDCHRAIHSGHTISDYKRGAISKEKLLGIIEKSFKTISEYNETHADREPLRLYKSFLRCLKDPELRDRVIFLINKYHVEFYRESRKRRFKWSDWRLYFGNSVYPPTFRTKEDWAEKFGRSEPVKQYKMAYSPALVKGA